METPGKAGGPRGLACRGCLGREVGKDCCTSIPSAGNFHQPPPWPPTPRGYGASLGPRSEKLTMPPAGGRKSLLTPAKPGSGAPLLSEKRILEICTELFIVKAAWIPSKSKALGKKSPIGDPPRSQDSWVWFWVSHDGLLWQDSY